MLWSILIERKLYDPQNEKDFKLSQIKWVNSDLRIVKYYQCCGNVFITQLHFLPMTGLQKRNQKYQLNKFIFEIHTNETVYYSVLISFFIYQIFATFSFFNNTPNFWSWMYRAINYACCFFSYFKFARMVFKRFCDLVKVWIMLS